MQEIMSWKRLAALGLAAFFTLSFGTGVIAAPKKSQYTYLIGSTPQFAPIVVGVNKGFCKKRGLSVKFKLFTSGGVAAQSFIAGRGDFVNTGDWPAVRTWLKTKGKIVGLHPSAHYSDLSVVVAKSSIKNAKQLKGKKIAVWLGTTSEFFAAKYLDANGIKLSDVSFVNVKPAEMVVAIDRGDVDAFVIWQPFGWRSVDVSGSKVHILSTGEGYFTEYMVTSARKDFIDNDPDAAKAMIQCTMEGAEYARKNLDDASAIVGKQFKVSAATAKRMIKVMNMDVAFTPTFKKDMDDLNKFMISKGKSSAEVDWNKLFDYRTLKNISSGLVK
jgi:ABC-type nitrate/sulfonate/bicarbonate transport system substrate-binding protein